MPILKTMQMLSFPFNFWCQISKQLWTVCHDCSSHLDLLKSIATRVQDHFFFYFKCFNSRNKIIAGNVWHTEWWTKYIYESKPRSCKYRIKGIRKHFFNSLWLLNGQFATQIVSTKWWAVVIGNCFVVNCESHFVYRSNVHLLKQYTPTFKPESIGHEWLLIWNTSVDLGLDSLLSYSNFLLHYLSSLASS